MIRDYWVYQKRNVTTPWAIYVVKEFNPKNKVDDVCLDCTFYHEDIDSPIHAISCINWFYDTVSGYVAAARSVIETFAEFTDEDAAQLEKSFFDILTD